MDHWKSPICPSLESPCCVAMKAIQIAKWVSTAQRLELRMPFQGGKEDFRQHRCRAEGVPWIKNPQGSQGAHFCWAWGWIPDCPDLFSALGDREGDTRGHRRLIHWSSPHISHRSLLVALLSVAKYFIPWLEPSGTQKQACGRMKYN